MRIIINTALVVYYLCGLVWCTRNWYKTFGCVQIRHVFVIFIGAFVWIILAIINLSMWMDIGECLSKIGNIVLFEKRNVNE